MIQFLSLWIPSSQSAACLPACLLWDRVSCRPHWLGFNSPCSLGWPWISDPPSFTSQVLASQARAIMPDFIQHLGLNSKLPIRESTLPTELHLYPLSNQTSKWPRGNYFYSSWEEKKNKTREPGLISGGLTMHSLSPCIQWCIQLFNNQVTGGEEIPKVSFLFQRSSNLCNTCTKKILCGHTLFSPIYTLQGRSMPLHKEPWSRHDCLITPVQAYPVKS